ncbi:MAG TPA: glycerol-3-phosphate 1-O-acyltransferase [Gammaproteobacteria bacterium]|nr:glycerol-3-phosphate 1-O-acyltransferase [Gammaproteobacteria bacterium]
MLMDLVLVVLAYLMGSLSSAIILCRLAGLPDPREQGSGNPGATNVLRFGGKKLAALVLLGDMLKGLLPVLAAQWLALSATVTALVGMAAFLGHLFPLFFGFRGGKGVATSLGVLLGLSPLLGLSMLAVWLLMAAIFRISSLAAITAAVAAPLATWQILHIPAYTVAVAAMSLLLLFRHQDNIRKLLQGREPRIGSGR